jgi:hypothetical protein
MWLICVDRKKTAAIRTKWFRVRSSKKAPRGDAGGEAMQRESVVRRVA